MAAVQQPATLLNLKHANDSADNAVGCRQRQSRTTALHAALKQRILLLDGAMGTMIQQHKLEEADYRGDRFSDWHCDVKGNNDLLVLSQPQLIRDIHKEYLLAGADILETNTFNATTIAMADYDMQSLSAEINREGARLAREVAMRSPPKPVFSAMWPGCLALLTAPAPSARMSTTRAFVMCTLMTWSRPTPSPLQH